METREALAGRRSVRLYRKDPVSQEDLTAILESACMAPSAINLQHWYFVVVRSPEAMADFKEIMGRVSDKFHPILKDRFAKNPETVRDTETFLNSLGGAPVCILAFFLKNDYPDRDGAMQSVSAALENLMLAAWDRGLGTCWMSAPQRMGFGPELNARFAPDKGEFVAAVTLGYPAKVPPMPRRREGRYTIV
ncbi:nitroreductase family protein [Pseudoflavonifractor phocaeensis]|uniref:nitroreductase family protein n=1 Tax=Pseudoflavonifractor phocaeensis TaxID=1870988 RepID=UPI00195B7DC1|nr:nitroreductase family protein [Pseudoflavonifractor phocaeensis]MBM6870898.1 nitroreductase family protein [Pseudoflavonifractor phocaeensis]MBM6937869.1 nitroreductase family protein [Pseudoflavonifractor phocaeensis]